VRQEGRKKPSRTFCGTARYSVAQVRELLDALNLITEENNRTNANLEMLFREKESPYKRKWIKSFLT
jgi:hypothetical protein